MSDALDAAVELHFEVTDADTAVALGSGDVPVLGTPRLLAWLEAATCAAAGPQGEGRTTVGTRVEVRHLLATPVGGTITVSSSAPSVEGRRLSFAVRAVDGDGALVADGVVERASVSRARFSS